jgi:hypothetical protein
MWNVVIFAGLMVAGVYGTPSVLAYLDRRAIRKAAGK